MRCEKARFIPSRNVERTKLVDPWKILVARLIYWSSIPEFRFLILAPFFTHIYMQMERTHNHLPCYFPTSKCKQLPWVHPHFLYRCPNLSWNLNGKASSWRVEWRLHDWKLIYISKIPRCRLVLDNSLLRNKQWMWFKPSGFESTIACRRHALLKIVI